MNDIWDLVKDIEEDLKGKEYCIPDVTFFFCANKAADLSAIKQYLIDCRAVKEDYTVKLVEVPNALHDVKLLCARWHFDEDITGRIEESIRRCKGCYWFGEDLYGNGISEAYRILDCGDGYVILDFYATD